MIGTKGSELPFNSPVETGIRSVGILAASYPRAFDLQRLIAFDYLVVHSADAGGPDSLHADLPMRNAELLVRRTLVERGLMVMMTRQLVERRPTASGILYRAGEMAAVFLANLTSEYMALLQLRSQWVADTFGDMPEETFDAFMRSSFGKWVEQFQVIDQGASGKP